MKGSRDASRAPTSRLNLRAGVGGLHIELRVEGQEGERSIRARCPCTITAGYEPPAVEPIRNNSPVKARFWPLLEPLLLQKS